MLASIRRLLGRFVTPSSRLSLTVTVVAALLVVNAIAIGGIVAERRDARREAERELRLETEIVARSLEARLADLRTDLLFLAQSPALAESLNRFPSDDPTTRRWSRLDLEGTLLLFLQAQPGIEGLTLFDADGSVVVRVGRRGGLPLLMPPSEGPPPSERRTMARFPVAPPAPSGSRVEATLRPEGLLRLAVPDGRDRIRLLPSAEPEPPADAEFVARARVEADGWEPPVDWSILHTADRSALVASVERVTRRFRLTVVLNMVIVLLTVLVGWLLLRQSRHAERLAAESRHQVRLRELEKRLAHSEKLASLGRLSAGLAHEINNPLEGMGNYLGVLASDLDDGDIAAARSRLAKVREGLDRAAGVLRRVLLYSRPPASEEGEEIDLAAVASETVEFARGLRDLEGVTIRFSCGVAPVVVRGDAGALGQLVLNLLVNAGQLQQGGGEVEVDLAVDGERAVLEVSDRGPGLDPQIADRLFEPFQSTRGSSGLGLSVCQGIARAHGGSIGARDRPGGGTTFEVVLPRLLLPPTAEQPDEPVEAEHGVSA